jgi:hypothetical protein
VCHLLTSPTASQDWRQRDDAGTVGGSSKSIVLWFTDLGSLTSWELAAAMRISPTSWLHRSRSCVYGVASARLGLAVCDHSSVQLPSRAPSSKRLASSGQSNSSASLRKWQNRPRHSPAKDFFEVQMRRRLRPGLGIDKAPGVCVTAWLQVRWAGSGNRGSVSARRRDGNSMKRLNLPRNQIS